MAGFQQSLHLHIVAMGLINSRKLNSVKVLSPLCPVGDGGRGFK